MASAATKDLYISDPEKWLNETAQGADMLCLVVFCGTFNDHDKHYLHRLGQCHQKSKNNFKLVAWTSQGQDAAKQADEEWCLTKEYGFDAVLGDDDNNLAQYLVDDVILSDLVTTTPEEARQFVQDTLAQQQNNNANSTNGDSTAAATAKSLTKDEIDDLYPNGMALPAMLWYAHHGSIALHWASKKSTVEGALLVDSKRPEPVDTFQHVLRRKVALDRGDSVMPVHGKEIKLCDNENEAQD